MKLLRQIRETLDKDLRLERLRTELAEVITTIDGRQDDPLLHLSAEEQKVYIKTTKQTLADKRILLERTKNEASVRLGITDEKGEWTEKFKKSVEANIGATEEEMEAGYSFPSGRFYAVLQSVEYRLVEADPFVILAYEAAHDASDAVAEAEFKLENLEVHTKTLLSKKSKLESDIDYILYCRMDKKKEAVAKRIRQLRAGIRKFDWKNSTDEQAESEARVLFGGEKE